MEKIKIIMAFFYSFLDKNIFINQLKEYIIDMTLVYHLPKILYSLKQAFCI